jgi:hypothetical protein
LESGWRASLPLIEQDSTGNSLDIQINPRSVNTRIHDPASCRTYRTFISPIPSSSYWKNGGTIARGSPYRSKGVRKIRRLDLNHGSVQQNTARGGDILLSSEESGW